MSRCLILLLSVALLSCNEEVKDIVVEQGYDFFPVSTGQYRIYQVDEVLFTGSVADSSHYFLKEIISDSIVSGDQTISYLLEMYRAEDLAGHWTLHAVWTTRKDNLHAVVTENNLPFVKMVFPVKAGRSWDGNAHNSMPRQDYYYLAADGYVIPGADSVVKSIKVVIADVPPNIVDQDQRQETYAMGIGLVEKDYISLSFCQSGCPTGEIEDGRVYRQSLVAYGKE